MSAIDHVVVLMLENRSFDHLLGFLPHPDPDYDGLTRGGPHTNPGWGRHRSVAASPGAKPVLPAGPDHSHAAVMEQLGLRTVRPGSRPKNNGFVRSYERKGRGLNPPVFAGLLGPLLNATVARSARTGHPTIKGRGPLVMLCQSPDRIPVLTTLALQFAVCTRWFCSVPGETWPNRNFAHAGTSDGETEIVLRPYDNETIFERLEQHGKSWHIYHDDTPQVWAFHRLWDTADRHANWFPFPAFARHVASGTLPAYSFLEPNHRPPLHTLDHAPVIGTPGVSNSQHPENNLVSDDGYDAYDPDRTDNDFCRAESLVAGVYEALRANPAVFDRTVLLITYDEHGGMYDHVPPPVGVPAPGPASQGLLKRLLYLLYHRKVDRFDFTMLGPRVPAIVVSPRIAAGTVDRTVHDHASIPSTLRQVFMPGAPPLTARDAWSPPFHGLLTLPEPRTDLPNLSTHVQPERADIATEEEALDSPTADTAAGGTVPEYYMSFVGLADDTHDHLVHVGEPEAVERTAPEVTARAVQTTQAFAAAASRHRQEQRNR